MMTNLRSSQPRPGSRSATVLAVALVLLLGVGAVLTLVRRREDAAAAPQPPTASLVPASAPPSTHRPLPVTAAPAPHFSYQEQAQDWDYHLGNRTLHAQWAGGSDHPSCADIESAGKLTALGCRYAAEMDYRVRDGAALLTQFVLGMADTRQAAAAAPQISDTDLALRPGTVIDRFALGKWKADSEREFVVVTVMSATGAVDQQTATDYLHYLHVDMLDGLRVR
jgi:hypothetical protein